MPVILFFVILSFLKSTLRYASQCFMTGTSPSNDENRLSFGLWQRVRSPPGLQINSLGKSISAGLGMEERSLLIPSPTVIDKEDGGFRLHSKPFIVDRRLSWPRIGPDAVRFVGPLFNF